MIRLAVRTSLVSSDAWVDDGFGGRELRKAVLSGEVRGDLAEGDFALPGRRYPIHDEAHARNALARVAQHGTPEEQARVKAAVRKRYPHIAVDGDERMEKAVYTRAALHRAAAARRLGLTEEEVEAARAMEAVGPPNEWSGSAAAGLGEARRALYQRTWKKLDKPWRDAIVEQFKARMSPMQKGEPVALSEALRGPMEPGAVSFDVGDYVFRFRKAGRGLPILTVRGKGLPMPYHMVVRGLADARQRAPGVAQAFAEGKVPDEGVFRREDDAAVAVRYPGRTQAPA